jgi:hypothetical protein
MKHYINIYIYTHISTHTYKYMYAHHISINTSKKLDRLDIEIHELSQRASNYRQ